MNSCLESITSLLRASVDTTPERAAALFKTEAGEYSEHDLFLGVRVPTLRTIAKRFKALTLADLECLLQSAYNEERLLALLVLVLQYQKASAKRDALYAFYMEHLDCVNNWNLVDSSAYQIVGAYLWGRDRSPLFELAQSESLWERRIAIVGTRYFINQGAFGYTFAIATRLLEDPEDLIHKATGWMLREVGKRDETALVGYLEKHSAQMPRTMLRYALERLSAGQRKSFL